MKLVYQLINAKRCEPFERFVENFLGDVAIWDYDNKQYLSKKIRRYYFAWNFFPDCDDLETTLSQFKEFLKENNEDDYYEIMDSIVYIDRTKQYKFILESKERYLV